MNQKLQQLLDSIQQSAHLSDDDKNALVKTLKEVDKEIEITTFKLDRTEKVKRTTAILLEETIEELEQKRKAVEAQNRELEIESSLERVRTVAMSMNKPDDMLDVCKTIALQLQLLGVKEIRNVQTAIFYQDKGTYMNYEFYAKHDKTFVTETVYTNHKVPAAFAEQMFKGKGEVYTTHIKGSEVKDWLAYQRSTNVFIDTYLEDGTSLNYYWHSLGPVALGISTYDPLSDDALQLFQRFLKVFDLSYRRYLDIEKAIAQAKEAQIETSLERVRAQAMAMRTPEDLTGICEVLYAELHILGFTEARNAMINIYDDEKRTFVNYDYSDAIGKSVNHLHYNIHPVIENQIKQLRNAGEPFSETYFKGKDLEDMKAFRKTIGEPDDPRIDNTEALYYYFYSIGTGAIGISTFSGITEEKLNVLKRFRNVFNLSYQRYTDIALAEVQAKEAKIELALERVRSRSLAMHNTSELQEVIHTVHKELLNLDIAINGGSFITINSDIDKTLRCWGAGGTADTSEEVILPLYEKPFCTNLINNIKKGPGFFTEEFTQQEKKDFFTFLFQHEPWSKLDAKQKEETLSSSGGYTRSCCVSQHTTIFIINHFGEKFSTANNDILQRFAKVFEQTYTRFLDLQKAEAQAKEAQIETALERVRSRSMAMQKSEELKEVIKIVYQQLRLLNINLDHAGFVVDYKPGGDWNFWIADEQDIPSKISHPYFESVWANQFNGAKEKGEDVFVTYLNFDEKNKFYNALLEYIPGLPETSKDFYLSCPALAATTVLFDSVSLYIENFSGIPYSIEENNTLMRFGKVFQQTYTRFIDLQKAEAQSREAQIQLALERGRTQSMIMQHSKELDDTLRVFHEQVLLLGINSAFSFLWLPDEEKNNHIFWAAWAEDNNDATVFKSKAITYPLDRNEPATAQCLIDWKSGEPVFSYAVPPEGVPGYFAAWQELIDGVEKLTPAHFINGLYYVEAFMKYGCFGVMLENDLTADEKKILDRFATEFERAYTRFLDLQKAEEQTKESQVQLAMERVRARTMAMQHSDELPDAANILFQQVQSLGMAAWSAGYCIWDNDKKDITLWMSSARIIQKPFRASTTEDPSFIHFYEAWNRGETFYVEAIGGSELVSHYKYMCNLPVVGEMLNKFIDDGGSLPAFQIYHLAFFSQGFLLFITYEPVPEAHDIFKRFGNVFEQTYTRFLDLQKAEAQAKEATIEAALERVRSRSMAMHKSDELLEAAEILFVEMQKLNIESLTAGYVLIDKEEKNGLNYTPNPSTKKILPLPIIIPHNETIHMQQVVENWKKGNSFLIVEMDEAETIKHQTFIAERSTNFPLSAAQLIAISPAKLFLHNFYFKEGYVLIVGGIKLSAEQTDIMLRFTKVFQQTYTRFLDLQKAEAQAREAHIEAALERVRSRTLAMQKSDELAETAAEVFRQLISLGIEPNRLYIGIVKEETGDMEMWATDEDGTHVGKKFMFNKNENISVKKLFDGWKAKEKSVIVDMEGKELEDYFHYLNNVMHIPFKSGLTQKRRVQSVAYFSKGFIGMASPDGQGDETIQLLERFAAVFNHTFTRFNDLKIAEAHAVQAEEDLIKLQIEKKRAEDALGELRATQTQLIQSEKMASLGELTAGIAHEIQNPLNFVNNFSEVSNELMDEMNAEIEKGDLEEAKLIANDIKVNLEKINHHGKRADAIVKGMLQHSRSSSGTKELTDINKLADEYLRLAYHGLRAKDKFFNATLKTEYDETLEKVNIIPQDIGRVILNLITNAFYVVNEKALSEVSTPTAAKYEPTVTVSSKKLNNKVLISVADNGKGIPKNIIDKIFQPFFTTKPTGQGTGLGLSLAYDIVKAHGGELKVETKEGEGSIFFIQLPV